MKNCQKLAFIFLCILCSACSQNPFAKTYSGDVLEGWQMAEYQADNKTKASSGSKTYADVQFTFSDEDTDYVRLSFLDMSLKLKKTSDGMGAQCDGEVIKRQVDGTEISLNASGDLNFEQDGGFQLDLSAGGVEESPSISYSLSVDAH